MKKKIEWIVVDANDRADSTWENRLDARAEVKWLKQNMFDQWLQVEFPVRIVRKEWLLVSDKVVR